MPDGAVAELMRVVTRSIPARSVLTIRRIIAAPRVQKRVAGAERSEQLIEAARELRLQNGTPFWHVLFLLGQQRPDGVPVDIARSALFHQDPESDRQFSVDVVDGYESIVELEASQVRGRDALAIDSRVRLPDSSTAFIPMLDFTVKSVRPGGVATAIACVEALDEPGVLVSSGRSFHFYGSRLMTIDEQRAFWSRSLLLTPMVDERWIAHQLQSGRAALRVSANERGVTPSVVREWPMRRPSTIDG